MAAPLPFPSPKLSQTHHLHSHFSCLSLTKLPGKLPNPLVKPPRLFPILAGKTTPKSPTKTPHQLSGQPLRVAVIGGGPAGAVAAETLAAGGIQTFLIERNPSNAKPCGGAIPLCMIGEFNLPPEIIDRKVTRMKIISPSNLTVDFDKTLKPHEFIGMLRREILDSFLRTRAQASGSAIIPGLFLKLDLPETDQEPYTVHYIPAQLNHGTKRTLQVDAVIGADGANSRVARSINAGNYTYAIAFQERMQLPDEKMTYYENLAEMYVGRDVSPDFYGWVFPKCDHVAVGTGTVVLKPEIKRFQAGIKRRVSEKISGGKVIKVEAHPIPEHPRPKRVIGRVALVGDAAGYVTKCSGEGIYFAAKSGKMCGEAIVKASESGRKMITEGDLLNYYIREWDKAYLPMFRFMDVLQGVFYGCDYAREALVELCGDEYVQRMTFESYLYKRMAKRNAWEDVKLLMKTVGSLTRARIVGRAMERLVL